MSHSISYYELLNTEWPEEIFIEGGMLSRGDTMLVGCESKGGKTTLLNDIRRALLTGGNFLGYKVVRPLKVLSLQAELREARLKERLAPTYTGMKEEFLRNSRTWATKNQVIFGRDSNLIAQECDEFKPDVLEIDPMINFHKYNENNATEMANFFREIDILKDRFNFSVIMAQHFKKQGDPKQKTSLLDMIRGSTSMRGWASTTIAMEGRTPTEYRELAIETRNSDEAIKRVIKYNKDTKSFDWHNPVTIIGEWAENYLSSKNGSKVPMNEFIAAMTAANGELLSHNRQKAFDIKNMLSSTKIIKITPEGKYSLVSLY
jgi:RecA-family ATPase